jgi:uncharacterized membrane protein
MEIQTLFYEFLNAIVTLINLVGVMIIVWGFVVAAWGFVRMKLHRYHLGGFIMEANKIRVILGTYILFGLEFMIAADIIHTFIKPTQEDLLALAVIVAIRTVISYFLGREIEEARQ